MEIAAIVLLVATSPLLVPVLIPILAVILFLTILMALVSPEGIND